LTTLEACRHERTVCTPSTKKTVLQCKLCGVGDQSIPYTAQKCFADAFF